MWCGGEGRAIVLDEDEVYTPAPAPAPAPTAPFHLGEGQSRFLMEIFLQFRWFEGN